MKSKKKRPLNLKWLSVVSKKKEEKEWEKEMKTNLYLCQILPCATMVSTNVDTLYLKSMFNLNLFNCFWKCKYVLESYLTRWHFTKTNLIKCCRNYKTFIELIIKFYNFSQTSQLLHQLSLEFWKVYFFTFLNLNVWILIWFQFKSRKCKEN